MNLELWSATFAVSAPVLLFGTLAWAVVRIFDSYMLYKADCALEVPAPKLEWKP